MLFIFLLGSSCVGKSVLLAFLLDVKVSILFICMPVVCCLHSFWLSNCAGILYKTGHHGMYACC